MQPSNEKVLQDSTKAAKDAAKMIGGSFEQAKGFTPNSSIPIASIDNQSTPLDIPRPNLDPTSTMTTASSGADAILAQSTKDAEKQMADAKTSESSTDSRIKELFGLKGQGAEVENQLRNDKGIEDKQRLVNQITAKAGLVSNQKALFDLNTSNLSYENQLEASKNDITKRTFSAQDSRFRLERALEANAQASELIGLNAQYQMASGDLKAAQESIEKAMAGYYKPIETELEMQRMFFTRNTTRMSDAQKGVADAKRLAIDEQLNTIENAKRAVSSAVASGYASAADIDMMTNTMAEYPDEQERYAQHIIGRAARAMAAPKAGSAVIPTIKSINGVDMQWNPETGTWEVPNTSGLLGQDGLDASQKSIDQLSFLGSTITDAINLAGENGFINTPVGPSLITQGIGAALVGNTSAKRLEGMTNTIKTNVMSIMTDPEVKKFFGPQMSNADVTLMTSVGTTLNNYTQNAGEYKAEAARVQDLVNRALTAVKNGRAGQLTEPQPITAPDGQQIIITD